MGIRQTRDPKTPQPKQHNVQISLVGAGPASLSCATFLGRLGYNNITIYEKQNYTGGLRYFEQTPSCYLHPIIYCIVLQKFLNIVYQYLW